MATLGGGGGGWGRRIIGDHMVFWGDRAGLVVANRIKVGVDCQ